MKDSTPTEENYLKAIYKCLEKGHLATTKDLALALNIAPATVTEMLKRLSDKQYLVYTPYKGVSLTSEGQKKALRIIRKHRLWEVFLVNSLGFNWDEVHETAEQLEHIEAPKLIERLDEFLGFPKFDPHGDPIPDEEGLFTPRKTHLLSEIEPGNFFKIEGVLLHSPDFLQFLDRMGLNIGATIFVIESITFNNAILVAVGEREILLGREISENLIVSLIAN